MFFLNMSVGYFMDEKFAAQSKPIFFNSFCRESSDIGFVWNSFIPEAKASS